MHKLGTLFTIVLAVKLASAQDTTPAAPVAPVAPVSPPRCTKTCDLFAEVCVSDSCRCIETCPPVLEDEICSSSGKEYMSRCEYYRDQCLCKGGEPTCKNKGVENDFIAFYGRCSSRPKGLLNTKACTNYNRRLGKWFETVLTTRQSQTYTSGKGDEYNRRLFRLELKLYSALDGNEKSWSSTVTIHGPSTANYDPRLITFWFCSLDADGSNNLSPAEQSQITRILLPSCPCIDGFLKKCRGGDDLITLPEFLGTDCFNVKKNQQVDSCAKLSLNPSKTFSK